MSHVQQLQDDLQAAKEENLDLKNQLDISEEDNLRQLEEYRELQSELLSCLTREGELLKQATENLKKRNEWMEAHQELLKSSTKEAKDTYADKA